MSSIHCLCQFPVGLLRTSEEIKEEGKKTDDAGHVGSTEKLFFALRYCAMSNRELPKNFKQTNGIKKFLVLEQSFWLLCREQIYSDQSGSSKASLKAIEVFQARYDCE